MDDGPPVVWNGGVTAGADDLEKTWRVPGPPLHDAETQPLDATLVGNPQPPPPRPLPPISVGEPAGDETGMAETGPDLVVLGLLGEGGMGRVQLARQRSLQREVAIKRPRAGASEWDAQILRAEALVTGHLEHPNIVPVHALGVDRGGSPVIVMKRVEGVSWRELLHDRDHPGWARREPDPDARLVWHLGILAQLCNAIAFAHSRGFVHRDMKPDNVMVGEFGEVYLIDWGVAVRTAATSVDEEGNAVVVGTPAYMAPEMAQGGPIDEQTDVYLLGATLHEILTGEVRHRGNDLHTVTMHALLSRPFRYADHVPDELADLANQATSVDPGSRPRGALAFRQGLLDHLRHRGSVRLSADADRAMALIEADPAGARGRAIEACRFGYREALREWPENRDALLGLQRCALATVRLELQRRDAAAARAAVAELAAPPPELAAAVARLEAELAGEEAERERLRRIAHDVDPTVGAPARLLMFAMLLVVIASVVVYAARLHRTGDVPASQLIAFPALLAVGSLAFLFMVRRQLAVNAFNRRLAVWFALVILALLGNRVIGQSTHLDVAHQFVSDGLVLGLLLSAGGIFLFRWMWMCAALMLGAVVIGTVMPAAAQLTFAVACLVVIVIAGALVQRRRPEP
jgi:serine/threonine-protein kinase